MTDKKLTDIKELLKYKAKVGCQNCDLIGKGCCSTCVNSLIKSFIEIFDRLQAENERLRVVKKHIDILIHRGIEYPTAESYNEVFQKALEKLYDNTNAKA